MKFLIYTIITISLFSCSGSGVKRASKADIAAVKEAAAVEAAKVFEHPEGSMRQEAAILSVRAKESALREAGFEECADSFAAEAKRILMPVLKSDTVILE